ncbi:MAG: TDT family transporter [Eggerthellaceae bacterium]
MREFLAKVPIPTGGVALGLAALGILLKQFSMAAYIACGISAALMLSLLLGRLFVDASSVRKDFDNPILASVSATFLMALMQLTTYVAPFAYVPALLVWSVAVLLHAVLIVWFTMRHLMQFQLKNVYPTYFICYVGIIVASVSSPAYGLETLGQLSSGSVLPYIALLVLVTARYVKYPVEEGARPLFCIYTAPMSLSLAGYLAVEPTPNAAFACALAVLAQVLLVVVLARLPHFLRLKFYPSYAAMTFPFVITATALDRTLTLLANSGVAFPAVLHLLAYAEVVLACVMVLYVFVRYIAEFVRVARYEIAHKPVSAASALDCVE